MVKYSRMALLLGTVIGSSISLSTYGVYKSEKLDVNTGHKKRFIIHKKASYRKSIHINGFEHHQKKESEVYEVEASEAKAFVKQSLSDPTVTEVEEDIILQALFEPGDGGTTTDTNYNLQWHYFSQYGVNLPAAWDITRGNSQTVVAVIDSGIRPHKDLEGRILPGVDLVSDIFMANDGNGRDSDPSDPGDWIERGDFCYTNSSSSSTWHGTHVAGTIGANSGNGYGVAGVNWNTKILPVRVLGKCGGYLSDIADGIRWAAGASVAGVPNNQNPAQVINLSLGGLGSCSTTIQSAIDEARARGAVVVVAAGNDGRNLNLTDYTPANCYGVINVGASERYGQMSFYSNYGNSIDVMAPGGDNYGRVVSLSNSGTRSPAGDDYKGMIGTSMAAPHVAGVASLILSVNPGLFPNQVEAILKETAMSVGCQNCGAGIIDAYEAIRLAQNTAPDSTYQGSEPVRTTPNNGPEILTAQDEDSGGICGTVDFNQDKGDFGGSGLIGFVLSFLLMMLISKKAPSKNYFDGAM